MNSKFDDIDDSGDDENIVSVNDLLTQAAKDPDSDGNTSDVDRELGSPLSPGSALAPANTTYHNTLLCIFHDAAQAARDRLSAHEDEQPVSSSSESPPSQPSLSPMLAASSQSAMTSTQSQFLGQRSINEDPNRDDVTPSAGINSNGKRPHSQLPVHDKENLELPLPPVRVSNKKPRGSGPSMVGRGGHHKK